MVSKSGGAKKTGESPARKRAKAVTSHTHDHDAPGAGGDPVVQVRVVSGNVDEFRRFVETTPLEFSCASPRVGADGTVSAHVLMHESAVQKAQASDAIRLEIVAHPADLGDEGPPQVGEGNRFEDPSVLPTGRGVLLRKSS
ncbi:hypothetical protein [Caballeronia insecticola]|uniref:Uncharacterized protein n=1 Tax=Caballeronia insecticola TaxID=758793 RepID=R4WS96_9BURK|nr:hypothetical protein [Caballeronia insecticola]BAN27538.1 hypothetical protein BRPE64_DCDS06020 [Caballeronia insecticola]